VCVCANVNGELVNGMQYKLRIRGGIPMEML